MRYLPIPTDLYTHNRQRFTEKMAPDAIAIFPTNPFIIENGDATYPYRPASNVLWLSGIEQPGTFVILFSERSYYEGRQILVTARPDPLKEKWTGHILRKEEARRISGIREVLYTDEFEAALPLWMRQVEQVYLPNNEHDRRPLTAVHTEKSFTTDFQKQYPGHHYLHTYRILQELRAIKTADEIAIVQKAVAITGKAFDRVMKFTRAGVYEFEIEAAIAHEFTINRATRPAYGSIVATGKNACILHYVENNAECRDGELILMDFGAEYGYYNADMSRTIPVNGAFTPRQAAVYNSVLNIFNYAQSILKPGIRYDTYAQLVNEQTEKECLKLGLITASDIRNQDPENPAFRKYFYHGIGHHLGVDVHDMGTYNDEVKEGMLFTIEPGLYIEEENTGVRIENNFWITRNGPQDLFKGIPITVEEIEAAMKQH